MTTIEFELPGLPKMTNTLRVHWRLKHSEAKKWKAAVYNAVSLKQWTPIARPKLTLTRCSAREPDYDGLVSSFKHVIDGLKEAGVIEDDKVSMIGQPQYHWLYAPARKGKIIVKVEGRAA